jgi:hypothetical protein
MCKRKDSTGADFDVLGRALRPEVGLFLLKGRFRDALRQQSQRTINQGMLNQNTVSGGVLKTDTHVDLIVQLKVPSCSTATRTGAWLAEELMEEISYTPAGRPLVTLSDTLPSS